MIIKFSFNSEVQDQGSMIIPKKAFSYTFIVQASGTNYTAFAIPTSTNAGRYGYYSTPDAVVRYGTGSAPFTASLCNPCFPTGQSGNPVQ